MNASDTQLSKPPAKAKSFNSAKPSNGQSRTQSQQPQSQARTATPTHEQIAARAYQLYVESGFEEGRDNENWFRAEQLLRK
ncbi:MAG TPA: DUF2934 domain-containing protein [Verrucomicrobiae bacterium]|jgi:hypothetical protein